MNMAKLPLQKR